LPDLRQTIFLLGALLAGLAAFMLLTAFVDVAFYDDGWKDFLVSAAITGGVGGAMILGFRPPKFRDIAAREGFILTTAAWVVVTGFATLPILLSEFDLSFAQAYFEAMSGFTTSGGTVIVGLDNAPKGLLLWRALLQWMGGIGIIVVAIMILPLLRVGGMQLFRMESSDKTEKVRPRVTQVAILIGIVYLLLTLFTVVALMLAGMTLFDAVCHAMTSVSTAGFSVKDGSIGHYDNAAVEWILIPVMAIGGCTFVLMAEAAGGKWRAFVRDEQVRWYFGYMAFFIVALATWQIVMNDRPVMDAIRSSAFAVVALATTTGFVAEDYTAWGAFPIGCVMILFFVGGCTGSTSGGMKVFRFAVLGNIAIAQIRHLVHPSRMLLPSYNGRPISDDVTRSVLSFFFFYIGCFAVLTMLMTAFGLDLITAMSGVAQALGNVGPGLGPIIGPAGNYATLADGPLWLLSLAMMLGRLELLTVLVLLSPAFWRG
jgi:trk system potassium uptake protein TrkH